MAACNLILKPHIKKTASPFLLRNSPFFSLFRFYLNLLHLPYNYHITTASSKSSAKLFVCLFSMKRNHAAFSVDARQVQLWTHVLFLTNQLLALRASLRQHIWLRKLRKLQERKCDVALTHNRNGKAILQMKHLLILALLFFFTRLAIYVSRDTQRPHCPVRVLGSLVYGFYLN